MSILYSIQGRVPNTILLHKIRHRILRTMICAGHSDGKRDACTFDSGGPLICQRCESCSFYIAGIVSFGRTCGETYGVYTRVSTFEPWITSITGKQGNAQTKSCPIEAVCPTSCNSLKFGSLHFFETNDVSSTGHPIFKDYQSDNYLVPVKDRSNKGFTGWIITNTPDFSWAKEFSYYITSSGYRNDLKCPNDVSYKVYDATTGKQANNWIQCNRATGPGFHIIKNDNFQNKKFQNNNFQIKNFQNNNFQNKNFQNKNFQNKKLQKKIFKIKRYKNFFSK